MMQTDVKSTYLAASGTAYNGPTRVKGLVIQTTADTAASVILTDGGASGNVKFQTAAPNAVGMFNILIPGEGIRFDANVYANLVSCTLVTFYG